jgi:hypothetical protein
LGNRSTTCAINASTSSSDSQTLTRRLTARPTAPTFRPRPRRRGRSLVSDSADSVASSQTSDPSDSARTAPLDRAPQLHAGSNNRTRKRRPQNIVQVVRQPELWGHMLPTVLRVHSLPAQINGPILRHTSPLIETTTVSRTARVKPDQRTPTQTLRRDLRPRWDSPGHMWKDLRPYHTWTNANSLTLSGFTTLMGPISSW